MKAQHPHIAVREVQRWMIETLGREEVLRAQKQIKDLADQGDPFATYMAAHISAGSESGTMPGMDLLAYGWWIAAHAAAPTTATANDQENDE